MRWPAYLILVYVLVGVQLGVGAYVQVRGVAPNLPLLAVVFVVLNAPWETALLAAAVTGLVQDVATAQPVGLFAVAYGLAAACVGWAAEFVRRGHPLTHAAAALVAGGVTGVVLLAHEYVRPADSSTTPALVVAAASRIGPRVVLVSTLYTALLAPAVVGGLQRGQRWFGFARRGRV